MANTTKKTAETDVKEVNNGVDIESLKKENAELKQSLADTLAKFEEVMAKLSTPTPVAPTTQVINTVSKIDTPCSIIHLCECHPELPTSIEVNGNQYFFTTFGERKTFRYQDLQNIVSRYRSWFMRGIFVLAEDCEPFYNELPNDIPKIEIGQNVFNNMTKMTEKDFEKFIKSMNEAQRVQIASTWAKRRDFGMSEYDNLDKLKILNKNTNGLLKEYISNVLAND